MPVTVQLPGYRHAIAPAIADAVNSGVQAYQGYKRGQLEDAQIQNEQLKNQALQQATEQGNAFKKAADTPGTPESDTIKAQHSLLADAFASSGMIGSKEGQSALNQWKSKISDPNISGWKLDQMTQNNSAMKEVVDLIKSKQMAQAQGNKFAALAAPRQDANQMRANSNYDTVIGKQYENRLDAAQRVKDLIEKARSGQLIPSENLGQQLATDINTLQTAGHSTVSGTEHSRPNTLFGQGGKLAHFVSGDPTAAITDADLAQMEKETAALYNDIGNQHKAKFASWIKGQPKDMQGPLVDRFQESRNQYFGPGASNMNTMGGGAAGGKPAPGGHQTVMQNGHSYTWNPQTGKYE